MLVKEFDLDLDEGITVRIQVSQGKYSPTKIWETKDEWLKFVEDSKGFYTSMSEDRREGLSLILKHALQRLHDRIDTWLPEALDGSSGSYVDVHVKIMLTDADEEILKHSAMTSMRLAEAEEVSLKLLDKFQSKS